MDLIQIDLSSCHGFSLRKNHPLESVTGEETFDKNAECEDQNDNDPEDNHSYLCYLFHGRAPSLEPTG
jgi:hypothetical protein